MKCIITHISDYNANIMIIYMYFIRDYLYACADFATQFFCFLYRAAKHSVNGKISGIDIKMVSFQFRNVILNI